MMKTPTKLPTETPTANLIFMVRDDRTALFDNNENKKQYNFLNLKDVAVNTKSDPESTLFELDIAIYLSSEKNLYTRF